MLLARSPQTARGLEPSTLWRLRHEPVCVGRCAHLFMNAKDSSTRSRGSISSDALFEPTCRARTTSSC